MIESRTVQCADIVGAVREVVADASHAAVVRDDAAAIAMDETAHERLGGFCDELFLP